MSVNLFWVFLICLLCMFSCGGGNESNPDPLLRLEIPNANKWFGGEDRNEEQRNGGHASRNVGTGQSIVLSNSIILESFSVHFTERFDLSLNRGTKYETGHQVDLILDIRNDAGQIIETTRTTVPSTFDGGWVDFSFTDQNMILSSNTEYIFTWFLENGEINDLSTGSSGNDINLYEEGTGYTAEIIPGESLKEWDKWRKHVWDFLFRVNGQLL